jgi:hypothetical protein
MDKEKKTEYDPETKRLLANLEKSLRHEVKVGLEYGFDLRLHWKEMLESLEEEKAAELPKRKLITLVSTRGKTTKEVSKEVWANYQKYLAFQANSQKKSAEQTNSKQRGSIIDVTDEGDVTAMIIGL